MNLQIIIFTQRYVKLLGENIFNVVWEKTLNN
jgi:hypothetical protein